MLGNHSFRWISPTLVLSLAAGICCMLADMSDAQSHNVEGAKLAYAADPANVSDAVARLQSGRFDLVHLELIAQGRAVEAIPSLRARFLEVHDANTKAKIAATLVRLGVREDSYWDYLVAQAKAAIESAGPLPVTINADGKAEDGPPPVAFVDWAKNHKLSLDIASNEVLVYQPNRVLMLAEAGDTRDVSLLREALMSANPLIRVNAALGLAEVNDTSSITLIANACRASSPDLARLLAESLIYFDDAQAQVAADKYLPTEQAKLLRERKAAGSRPFDRK